MPIAALPDATARAIGSTSVISDPCSVVKELLDNSLDALATSVVIEISQNTVDVIQVKDNGHGIPSEDHPFVCRRAFTSKIQTVEDLRKIGGKSLGFRGEALASAAEVSGSVTVTTRVEAEVVGSLIKYGRNGEVTSTQRASHPVGTTVRVTDLFKHIPVRRQTVLKNTSKTLARIKKIIQSYAIAQPSKRLSFKVLKARNESNNWMYSPGQGAKLMDIALKIMGTDVASSCTVNEWPSGDVNRGPPQNEGGSAFKFIALVPKPDADFAKINNAGQYISVDGRPLSSNRGIGQDIAKLYKSHLRSMTSSGDNSPNITDPFLCLQIRCPEGTYDVNIEPAKDDILFGDQQEVRSLIEHFFCDIYGEISAATEKPKPPTKGKERMTAINNGFELLLASRSPIESLSPSTENDNLKSPNFISANSFLQSPSSHPGSRVRNSESSRRLENGSTDAAGYRVSRDLELLNPWSVTRLNVATRTRDEAYPGNATNPRWSTQGTVEGPVRKDSVEWLQIPSETAGLPATLTPNSSRSRMSLSNSRFSGSSPGSSRTSPSTPLQDNAKRASRERDRERYGNGALDTWFQKTTQVDLRQAAAMQQSENDQEPSLIQLAQGRFGSKGCSPASADTVGQTPPTTWDTPSDSQKATQLSQREPQQLNLRSPRISPPEVTETGHDSARLDHWAARLHRLSNPDLNSDLEEVLDFENRKKEAMQNRREQIRNGLNPSSSNTPHLNRYLAARAALNPGIAKGPENQNSVNPKRLGLKPVLSPHDPRAYLMRHRSTHEGGRLSSDATKIRRINTNKLPFEKIPEGYYLYDVCLVQPADLSLFSQSLKQAFKTDLYTQHDDKFEGFATSDLDVLKHWESQLSRLIKCEYRAEAKSTIPTVQFDFSHLRTCLSDLDDE